MASAPIVSTPTRRQFAGARRSPTIQRILLALIFLTAVAYQCRLTVDIIRGEKIDVPNFFPTPATASLEDISPVARTAGMRPGDTLLEVNERPYIGSSVLAEEIAKAVPGSQISATLESQAPSIGKYTVHLPVTRGGSGPLKITFDLLLDVFMPFFCIFLGSWVVLVRPRDISSWLLLGLLLGFSHLLSTGKIPGWGPGIRELAMGYDIGLEASWAICMFLFGYFFPEPFPAWKKAGPLRRSLRFIPLIPLVFSAIISVTTAIREMTDYQAAHSLVQRFGFFQGLIRIYLYVIVGGFFGFIFAKSSTEISPDSRRRLRLLYWGTTAAMTPGLIVTFVAAIARKPASDIFTEWQITLAFLMLLLAPLTFGYVIVVQRAMDVRVVLRQGLQYGLATRGIRVMQFVIVGGLIFGGIMLTRRNSMPDFLKLLFIGAALLVGFSVLRMGDKLRGWIDRKFFREAYNTEQVLSDLSDQVRSMVETRPLIETVAARIAETLHVPHVAVLLGGSGPYRPAFAFGYGAAPDVAFGVNTGTVQLLEKQREPARVYLDDPDSWLYRDSRVTDGDRSQLATLDTELLLPLSARDRLLGFISLGPKLSEEPYSGTDVRLLKSVAAQTGLALENARLMSAIAEEVSQRERLNREVEIAREVQERLFPQTLPPILGVAYAGACRPALGIGGDYYDFLALPDGKLGLAIGDVSGKGISAALMMASLQASLRGETSRASNDLAAMVGNVNRLVFEASQSNRYATFFYAQYDPTTRLLTYVNAGHNPPMIFRKRQAKIEVIRLEATGTVVGLIDKFVYDQVSVPLIPGDLFLAFTDGISEAMNSDDDEWGEERLIDATEKCGGLNPQEILTSIMQSADAFVAGAKQHDDMTVVVLQVQPQ